MLNRIDLRSCPADPRGLLPRAATDVNAAIEAVRPVVTAIRDHGAAAVREACRRFDGFEPARLRVPVSEIHKAQDELDPAVAAALTESIARTRRVHTDQRPAELVTRVVPGGTVTQRWSPVGRVGLYVPGGLAVYPSSVVMNVVPAQIAGVSSLAVTSPARKDTGLPHPLVLAACGLLGVDEVYGVGGSQAIAMFGYGTSDQDGPGDHCPPVDLITGPGNIWVTAAKRLLRGVVGIDGEAGPTEVMILADDSADPRHIAADMISQAEHDPLAASVLVTDSERLIDLVVAELELRVGATHHRARVATALAGQQSAAVLVDDLDAGLRVANAYAAEHLEIQTRDAREVADRVSNAGAIFVGPWSPVSLGDYCAGSNHVLPTAGYARHSPGLSVHTFLKGIQVVEYDSTALRAVADHVVALATAEDLPAHGQAVQVRQES